MTEFNPSRSPRARRRDRLRPTALQRRPAARLAGLWAACARGLRARHRSAGGCATPANSAARAATQSWSTV